jgi:hypothetical protein
VVGYIDNKLEILSFWMLLIGSECNFRKVTHVNHFQTRRIEMFNEACPTK